jgi:hypothetical protein
MPDTPRGRASPNEREPMTYRRGTAPPGHVLPVQVARHPLPRASGCSSPSARRMRKRAKVADCPAREPPQRRPSCRPMVAANWGGGRIGDHRRSPSADPPTRRDHTELVVPSAGVTAPKPPSTFISLNWRGQPLVSYESVVNLIGATKTHRPTRQGPVLDTGPIRRVPRSRTTRWSRRHGRPPREPSFASS